MRTLKIMSVLLFAALFVSACNQSGTSGPSSPEPPAAPESPAAPASPEAPEPPSELAIGEGKYKEYCSKCHKEDGTGGKVEIAGKTLNAENLVSDKMKKEPDSEYIEYITKGIPEEGMPSFEGELSEAEMKAVVKYIREKLQSQ